MSNVIELALEVANKEIIAYQQAYDKLLKRYNYSEKRRRDHFLELEVLKYEYRTAARRLGKKRQKIRKARKILN